MTNGTDGKIYNSHCNPITCETLVMNIMRTSKIYILLCLAASVMTGCSKEEGQPVAGLSGLAEDKVIIDYTLTPGERNTRTVVDDRINSLHYLVYNLETDKLEKSREIPGISEVNIWPLTRENMTWEQRLALQDTLKLGGIYQVMFVANASTKLFGLGQQQLLQNTDKYSSACLRLPETTFSENNLYYFWTHTITAPSHEIPHLCNVRLQRIVTKTDVSRVDIPDKTTDPTGYDLYIKKCIETSVYEDIRADIAKQVKNHIDNFQHITNLAATTGILTTFTLQISYMNTELDNNEAAIAAYLKDEVVSALYERIKDNPVLAAKTADWNLGKNCKVALRYSAGKRADGFMLGSSKSVNKTPDNTELATKASDGRFTFYALSSEGDEPELNGIESLSLYPFDNEAVPAITIDGYWNTKQKRNTAATAICNPIGDISAKGGQKVTVDFYVDLGKLLTGEKWRTEAFEKAMYDVIFKPAVNKQFGDGFNNFRFSVELPSLKAEGVSFAPVWTLR